MANPLSGIGTFLQNAGSKILAFFKNDINPIIKDGQQIALGAEPIVDMAFPGIGVLFNATVAAIGNAEAAGQAASATGGNGAQKLASVLASIEPLAIAYLQEQGITANTAQITAWINAIVAALNALPAVTTPATVVTVGSSVVTSVKEPAK